ncbi:MAG: hypothetical protein JWN98_677 [Abditibacteriota bacterium]|nr:hypothetical protein [Abditibacteriota bacterium]
MKLFVAFAITAGCAFSLWPLLQRPPQTPLAARTGATLPAAARSATPAAPQSTSTAPSVPPRKVWDSSDARLDECSGLGASRRYPGSWWMHNDSGDEARLFLVDAKGKTRVTVLLQGAYADDWEDMAVAQPNDKGAAWVYVADIGDNLKLRDAITIYRFREPAVPPQSTLTDITVRAESLTLQFPDGARDAETLIANARGELMIVAKTTGASEFFVTPKAFQNGATQTLQSVGSYQFGESSDGSRRVRPRLTTGGDLSQDQRRIAICTYTQAHEWTLPEGSWKTLLNSKPRVYDLPPLPQIEAIAYGADGKSLFITSEGAPCPLWKIS